ncbi:GGDEF domain-containing protein [Nitrococcus mobilis]|nr:GGDEF domain-containing protein [Nitrococcus mobilis]
MHGRLRSCANLPTLSAVVRRIIKIGRNSDMDLGEVAKLLSSDPVLAKQMLRVANSPLYRQRRRSDNLRQALVLLGLNDAVILALGFSLARCLRNAGGQEIDLDGFWRRALLSGLACRLLGKELGMRSLEDLFLAGFLQDIGMVALGSVFPDCYASALEGALDHDAVAMKEREWFDADHLEVGAWLMREWGLPEYLPLAALASHDFDQAHVPVKLTSFIGCVALSGHLADIFLAPEMETTIAVAAQAGDVWLGIDSQAQGRVLAQMANSVPEIEALFEKPVLPAAQAMSVVNQARDLLAAYKPQPPQLTTKVKYKGVDEFPQVDSDYGEPRDQPIHRVAVSDAFSRSHFDESLSKEFALASELRWPLSLAFLELDPLNALNDCYGSQLDDAALMAIAQKIQIQAGLRAGDVLAHYEDEKFILLLPGIELAAAHKVIDRIRGSVRALEYPGASAEVLRMTLSAGAAAHMDGGRCFEKPEDLVRAAERALYLAKRESRNHSESILGKKEHSGRSEHSVDRANTRRDFSRLFRWRRLFRR